MESMTIGGNNMSFDKMIELASKIDFDQFFKNLKLFEKVLILMYFWTIHQTMAAQTVSELMGEIDEKAIEDMGKDFAHACEVAGIDSCVFDDKISTFINDIMYIILEKQAH